MEKQRRKAELRSEIAALRQSLTAETIQRLSGQATSHLLSVPELVDSSRRTVALYLSLPGELETDAFWAEMAGRGHRCVFPKVRKGSKVLSFHELLEGGPVVSGPLGVREPASSDPVPLEEIDVFIVPGAAFDVSGGRLGRGGGYYDATLVAAPRALRVGFGFDEQVVPAIPMLPHDAPLDWIVTPSRKLRCEPGRD